MKNSILLIWLIPGIGSIVRTQEIQVTGKVISGSAQTSLPGVNVVIKGTTQGCITNQLLNGGYQTVR
jgi:hypothetical protein